MFFSNWRSFGIFLLSSVCLSCCVSGLPLCVSRAFLCLSGLVFEDKFCTALAEPQCCSKLFFKNTGLGFFHFIFVSHCLACSGWQKLSGKKRPRQRRKHQKHTEASQKDNRKDPEKEEAQMPQIAEKHHKRSNCIYVKLVQTNMSQIHHTTGRRNLYCWITSENGDCLLL